MKKSRIITKEELKEIELLKNSIRSSQKSARNYKSKIQVMDDSLEAEQRELNLMTNRLSASEKEEEDLRVDLVVKQKRYRELRSLVDRKIKEKNQQQLKVIALKKNQISLNERIHLYEDFLGEKSEKEDKSIKAIKRDIDQLAKEDRDLLEIVIAEKRKYDRLHNVTKSLQKKLTSLRANKKKLHSQREVFKNDFMRMTNVCENIENTIQRIEKDNLHLGREVASMKGKAKEVRRDSDELSHELSQANSIHQKYQAQINELNNQIDYIKQSKEIQQAEKVKLAEMNEKIQKDILAKKLQQEKLEREDQIQNLSFAISVKKRLEKKYFNLDINLKNDLSGVKPALLRKAEKYINDVAQETEILLGDDSQLSATISHTEKSIDVSLIVKGIDPSLFGTLNHFISHSFEIRGDASVLLSRRVFGERERLSPVERHAS